MNKKEHRLCKFSLLVLLAWCCVASNVSAQTNLPSVAPEPDWVKPCEWSAPPNPVRSDNAEGAHYLLYEQQENSELKEDYTRFALLMENESGVQDSGSLSFSFDPGYQQLILHYVHIHRAGNVLDRLDLSKVKIIQPERELDGHMLTGKQTALLFVEDLRVGDVLEYAYTVRGANPILNGHYATRFFVQTSVPVDRQRMRVVGSTTKPLSVREQLMTTLKRNFVQTSGNGISEYLWDFDRLDAIPYEDYVPAGYERYPYIELSDFTNWEQVVNWALPLYASETALPPELQAQVNKWMSEEASPEERARTALQFVQDEFRYTALELGPDSYRPTPPAETFAKRYGDCKGKTLLLCVLLRAMNIEAFPALVNSSTRDAVTGRLPSPFDFDHVIVKLQIAGRAAWVDPTWSHQGGSIWERQLSRFGKALVIQPGVSALENVPEPYQSGYGQEVTSTFDIKDYTSPAALKVRTIYRGVDADDTRELLAHSDPKVLLKDYLNFYARYYSGIQDAQPFEVLDERRNNVLTVTEYYRIQNLWETNDTDDKIEAVFYGEALENVLTDPNTRLRKMPLRIPFPMHRKQQVILHLPDDGWDIENSDGSVDTPAFAFRYQHKYLGSTAIYDFDCETKVRELPAEQVANYLDKCDETRTHLAVSLYRTGEGDQTVLAQINWLMILIAAFAFMIGAGGCAWYWRASRVHGEAPALAEIPPLLPGVRKLEGLGGWLILIGFGLCISPLLRIIPMATHWRGYFSLPVWQAVAVPGGASYHPLYGPLLVCELMGNILLLVLNLLALFMFFNKRKAFPKVYILLILTNVAYVVGDAIGCGLIPSISQTSESKNWTLAFRSLFSALLWSAYMVKSRRVKATFVR